jgi:hypothetical protein
MLLLSLAGTAWASLCSKIVPEMVLDRFKVPIRDYAA